MKKIFFIITIIISLNTASYAACSGMACSEVKIEELYPTNGFTYITTDGIEANLTNCVPISSKFIKLLNSHSNADKIYSLLLSAALADREVYIRTNTTTGNTGECTINYVKLVN